MINIALFASGTGSNALNIHKYFLNHPSINVAGVYCNKPNAGIVKSAPEVGLKVSLFSKEELWDGRLLYSLKNESIDYIILAGFLWLIPESFMEEYEGKILNIHPSLLPKYGGKGMFGAHVHRAVIFNGEKESGITIHEVNKEYDKGRIIFQAKTEINTDDDADSLAQKIHHLEHKNFPKVIEGWINS